MMVFWSETRARCLFRSVFYGLERRWCAILGICIEGATSEAFTALFRRVEKQPSPRCRCSQAGR